MGLESSRPAADDHSDWDTQGADGSHRLLASPQSRLTPSRGVVQHRSHVLKNRGSGLTMLLLRDITIASVLVTVAAAGVLYAGQWLGH